MYNTARYGYVGDVLPAYNYLSNHLTEQLLHFEGLFDPKLVEDALEVHGQKSQLEINTINAQRKLQKYRDRLTSPVYAAALMLVPWNKWLYLEGISSAHELETHKSAVQSFYNTNYKHIILPKNVPEPEPEPVPTPASASTPSPSGFVPILAAPPKVCVFHSIKI